MRAVCLSVVIGLVAVACGDSSNDERVDALEQEVAALQQQLAAARADGAIAAESLTAIEDRLNDVLARLEAATVVDTTTIESLTAEVAALRAQVEALLDAANAGPGLVTLRLAFNVGDAPLELGAAYTISETDVRFTEVRYWLTGLTLVASDGSSYVVPAGYYLMEARGAQELDGGSARVVTLPATRRDTIALERVPAKTYTELRFNVGVDATYNDDLSKSIGELNVMQNMTSVAWMWFTSYIFTKTHGTFAEAQSFAWDNGTNADLRAVSLTLPAPVAVASSTPVVINAIADMARVFEGLFVVSTPEIGAAQASERATLANNWSHAFSVVQP